MSAEIDPAKLKVVELRAELSARGLDAKGIKAVLVKRLKDALEKELEKEIPDTSIADTSTEDINTSQIEESPTIEEEKKDERKSAPPTPNKEEIKIPEKVKDTKSEVPVKQVHEEKNEEPVKEEISAKEEVQEEIVEPVAKKPKMDTSLETSVDNVQKVEVKDIVEEKTQETLVTADTTQDTSEKPVDESHQCEENGLKKANTDESVSNSLENVEEPMETGCSEPKSPEKKNENAANDAQMKGDKRKRSPSPSKAQRRRSKSPVKEDEPVIDNSKVQLNWYDSDLHLQIDKESFLSGKPYHDGAFGYIWSGVRATHGANNGKVCYEVKITEELKWEDFIRQPDKGRRDRERKDSKRERPEKQDKSSDKKKSTDKPTDKKNLEDKDTQKQTDEENKQDQTTDDKDEKGNTEENAGEENKAETDDDKKEVAADTIKEVEQDVAGKEPTETEIKEEKTDEALDSSQNEETIGESMDVDEVKEEKGAEDAEDQKDNSTNKEEKSEDKEKELPQIPTHLIRIGWSSINSGLQLGESKFSYGYESSGKFACDKNFSDYGKSFGVGDVVGVYLEFTEDSVNIKYSLNGEELSVAISIPKSEVPEDNFSLFPHVLSRNFAFEVNLGGREEPFFNNPEKLSDYAYIDKFENKVMGPTRPETRGECEVIMMCGLPGSGKTHWVKEHVANNPDKRYTVIGNAQLLEKMTVNGNPLKNSMKGRWNVVLDKLAKCLNKLVEIAALRRRNYVIDQTNVFPSAQRRKMRSFEGFKRRAVIVVCGDEEQARRRALQESQDGKDVPNIAVYEMKANMSLPKVGDWLEEVTYVELDEQQAKAVVQKYNKEGKDNGFGPFAQRRDYRDDRNQKWHPNRRNDYRGGYRDRNYGPGPRFDRGNKHGAWQGRSGNYGRDDRRDNRGLANNRPRDWRNNNRGGNQRHQDRGRDRNNRHNRDGYNRNRSQGGSRNQGGNWQGNWGPSGGYGGSQGSWQGQGQGGGGGNNWNQGKWNYGGQGGGQQNYGNYQNWNYYGQYPNWSGQTPHQTGANSGNNSGGSTGWSQYPNQNSGNKSAAQK